MNNNITLNIEKETRVRSTKKYLIIFIAVTLASGWIGVLVDSLLTEQPEGNSLGMGVWLILPFLTAIALRIIYKDKKDLGLKPNIRQKIKWYMVSIAVFPLVTLIAVSIGSFLGFIDYSAFKSSDFISLALYSMLTNVIKNIFEEFSWRGYLTPKLMDLNLNDWWVYIISGLVWGLWHAAYYLVFLPEKYFASISRVTMLSSSIMIMLCWTVMFVEIYRLTKSVWPCVLMHAVEDAVPTVLVATGGYITFTNGSGLWLNPINGIVANILFLAIGLTLRKLRIRKEQEI